jgi:hypothetical protein
MLDEKIDNLNTDTSQHDSNSNPEIEISKDKIKDISVESENNTTKDVKKSKKNKPTVKDKTADNKEEISVKIENEKANETENDCEKKAIFKTNYDSLSLEKLLDELQNLVKNKSIPESKNKIEKIKESFNIKFSELLAKKKESFIEDGGNEIDFRYSNPIKSTFKDLLFEFKTKRQQYYKSLEQEQKENLVKRLDLIDDLKKLIDNAEPSTMYNQYKTLNEKWRSIGNIPRAKYNDTWRTYHHHVERFYDLLNLSNDLRELDFKHNLEEKLKLVERAEELVIVEDLNMAFKELQTLHKRWKEDVGPVDRENREVIWDRFSNATKKIHERRRESEKLLESSFKENIVKKRTVIDKIVNINIDNINSHKIWQLKIKELEALRNEFFSIGRAPRTENDKLWDEFKKATRNFNKAKNIFYKSVKSDQQENLNKKNKLIERAEDLKNSDDWDSTTNIMKQIQAEWKTIGHVPRKYSDKIWKQFKSACNYYFDRLHDVQDESNKEQIVAFDKKKELLENLKSQINSDEVISLDLINSYIDDWNKLGVLPKNMLHIESKFNKIVNNLYAKLDLGNKEIAMLKFKNIISNYLAHNYLHKIDNEQLFIRKKIDENNKEIQQLENNISFISNVEDDNPLLLNVKETIQGYKDKLDIWKAKLNYLTNLNY